MRHPLLRDVVGADKVLVGGRDELALADVGHVVEPVLDVGVDGLEAAVLHVAVRLETQPERAPAARDDGRKVLVAILA